jgi:hypothetical protein
MVDLPRQRGMRRTGRGGVANIRSGSLARARQAAEELFRQKPAAVQHPAPDVPPEDRPARRPRVLSALPASPPSAAVTAKPPATTRRHAKSRHGNSRAIGRG